MLEWSPGWSSMRGMWNRTVIVLVLTRGGPAGRPLPAILEYGAAPVTADVDKYLINVVSGGY